MPRAQSVIAMSLLPVFAGCIPTHRRLTEGRQCSRRMIPAAFSNCTRQPVHGVGDSARPCRLRYETRVCAVRLLQTVRHWRLVERFNWLGSVCQSLKEHFSAVLTERPLLLTRLLCSTREAANVDSDI